MTAIVGNDVKAYGDGVNFTGSEVDLNYYLSGSATSVKVNIYNDEDVLVRTIEGIGNKIGDQSVTWNGLNENDVMQPAGDYRFEVVALDADGAEVETYTYTFGRIDGIAYDEGSPYLMVNGQYVNLGDVISILAAGEASGDDSSGDSSETENAETSSFSPSNIVRSLSDYISDLAKALD